MATQLLSGQQDTPATAARLNAWRLLIGLSAAFLLVNTLALTINRPDDWATYWAAFGTWMVCAIGGSWLLERYLPGCDPLLFPLTMFMSGWGLVIISRLLPRFANRQILWLAISTVALVAAATLPHVIRWLRNYRYLLLGFGLILLVSTITFGTNPSGDASAPKLWLGFGNFFFQPSEALKIILVAFLASYLGEQYPVLRADGLTLDQRRLSLSPRIFGPILLMWGLSVIILVWQRDLGTAVLFFAVFLILLYVSSGNILIVISGIVLIAIAGIAAYLKFDVVTLRIDVWLNPWPEASGRAFQIVQSLQAFAAGGIFGQGIAQGSPFYIPVVHSDFIFAAVAEEWGLLGVAAVIASLAAVVMRGLRIATQRQTRLFHALLAVGLSTLIGIQSLLIMCGVLKLLPLTGVTLPFFSYGGSSLLASSVVIGLLLRLSAGEHEP